MYMRYPQVIILNFTVLIALAIIFKFNYDHQSKYIPHGPHLQKMKIFKATIELNI